MTITGLIGLIAIALILAGLDGLVRRIPPGRVRVFRIRFPNGRSAPALQADVDTHPNLILRGLGLISPRPVIFITGGAAAMSPEDIAQTRQLITQGIARFAEKHRITVVDGGTEAGVMEMMGEARYRYHPEFTLIGIAPIKLVTYPGYENPGHEAVLEDGHSHFVLLNANEWGAESEMILNLSRTIAGDRPLIGILINGGRIAEHEVYLASTRAENPIPLLIIEGSGRTADKVATAVRTGSTDNTIIRAIVAGGDIRLAPLSEGVEGLLEKLSEHFGLPA